MTTVSAEYQALLEKKAQRVQSVGHRIEQGAIHPSLFPHARDIVQWAVYKGRCAVFADCVAPDTIIHSPDGDERIDVLAARGRPIRVYAFDKKGDMVIAKASSPFKKGIARLYQFTLANGKSITVTMGHRFLTPNGWVFASDLSSGDSLAVSVPIPQESTSELYPLVFRQGVLSSENTTLNSQAHYSGYRHQYDGQPPQQLDSALSFSPLQVGAYKHDLPVSYEGDLANTPTHNPQQYTPHPSMQDYLHRDMNASDDAVFPLPPSDHESVALSNHNAWQASLSSCLVQSVDEFHPLVKQPCGGVPYAVSFCPIVSINYITTGDYYDMHVPVFENYLANGIVNHNTGLHKTAIQVEWARLIGGKVLILAPLAVALQTVRIAHDLLGIEVRYVRSMAQVTDDHAIYITNYEMVEHFEPSAFNGIVLDESSIIKSFDGATKTLLIALFADTPYKLCCTATPAPNDIQELGNHAEFLGICTSFEMTSMFFVHEAGVFQGQKTSRWRLKRHAKKAFYRWLASWAMAIKRPSDLGYSDDGFILPPLNIHLHTFDTDYTPEGMLPGFGTAGGISAIEARKLKRKVIDERTAMIAEMVNNSSEQWLIWADLNDETKALALAIPDSVDVQGSMSPDEKAKHLMAFADGSLRALITKGKIAGMGMNFQNAYNMAFMGLNYSWEGYYQQIRRMWRFGQTHEVNVHIFISEQETPIYRSVMEKEKEAMTMSEELIQASGEYSMEELRANYHNDWKYASETTETERYTMMLGDSCIRMAEIPDNSIDLSVYSPPFVDMYIYNATEHDLSNSSDLETFMQHYAFIIRENLRITKAGRYCCVHVQDPKTFKNRQGFRGIYDFSGMVIKAYVDAGWIFRARVTVDKNPQIVASRNKDSDLLFITGKRDATDLAPVPPDYVLIFRKDGDNEVPVLPYDSGEMDEDLWIEWAHGVWNGVWYGIKESDVLNAAIAKNASDEKHMCALQLPLIERCVRLYSNVGEVVFSPFGGIGSEGYEALKRGRRFIGIELKPEYYKTAISNLNKATVISGQKSLWDLIPQE